MPEYVLDLSDKGCPEGHPTIEIVSMNQELFEVRCSTCGWTGYDTDLIRVTKEQPNGFQQW